MILLLAASVGCSPSAVDVAAVDYTPRLGGNWPISTPAQQGLDPQIVAKLYYDAAKLETLYALLVIRNGHLVAEKYFNGGAPEQRNEMQSATKSVTSALVGVALNRGCLSSVDQRMLEFFPGSAGEITDPRKAQITIRDMLEMRSGYPDEERAGPALWSALLSGNYLPLIAQVPLGRDPGTEFQYSGLTSHWLGVIVARACGADLKAFAQEHLFSPIGAEVGEWLHYEDGDYSGLAGMHLSARDAAKLGLLYLGDGEYEGNRILPAGWVRESLQRHSEGLGSKAAFRDMGYGYQWWSARTGGHQFSYAAGHGGQYIVLLRDLNIVVVTAADPFWQQHDDESWEHEKAITNLVAGFIESLPSD